MVGIVGLLSVTIGAAVAYASERFPAHVESLETGAGFLLLSGFALPATPCQSSSKSAIALPAPFRRAAKQAPSALVEARSR